MHMLRYETLMSAVEEALKTYPLLDPKDGNQTEIVTEASDIPPRTGEVPQPLRCAMRYSLLLPGKRLRPVLLLASYAMLAEDWHRAMPFACAMEMIHTYSLIHDDLPALDDDALRRGQPTNHRVFGENIAILAGDGLLNMAYETMVSAPISVEKPAQALAAMKEIAIRAGVRGMIAGQTLDVKLEGTGPREEMVRYIHHHKTADLLTAPVLAGLLLADATAEQLEAGRTYGENLGLAFQIVDDLLDMTGDEEAMGKAVGKDAARGKMTWPAVYGMKRAREDARAAIDKAEEALAAFGTAANLLQNLAQETLVRVK